MPVGTSLSLPLKRIVVLKEFVSVERQPESQVPQATREWTRGESTRKGDR